MIATLIISDEGYICSKCGSVLYAAPVEKVKFCYHCGAKFTKAKRVISTTRDLTDEEINIYDSWLKHNSVNTGINIFEEIKGSDDCD